MSNILSIINYYMSNTILKSKDWCKTDLRNEFGSNNDLCFGLLLWIIQILWWADFIWKMKKNTDLLLHCVFHKTLIFEMFHLPVSWQFQLVFYSEIEISETKRRKNSEKMFNILKSNATSNESVIQYKIPYHQIRIK